MAPFPQTLVLTALGYSPGTPKGGLTARGGRASTRLDALKAADPATVKGKIVYVGYRMQRHEGRPRLRHRLGGAHAAAR